MYKGCLFAQFLYMNSEEFCNQVEQALIEDVRKRNDGIDKIAQIMEHIPAIPFKDMAPLFRILLQRF